MSKIIKVWFSIDAVEGGKVSKTFEFDKDIICLRGMTVVGDRDDMPFHRGSQRIEINREEIVPEGYHTKLLMSGINCPVNARYYDLKNMNPGNKSLKIDYTDSASVLAAFAAYKVYFYFECEKADAV